LHEEIRGSRFPGAPLFLGKAEEANGRAACLRKQVAWRVHSRPQY